MKLITIEKIYRCLKDESPEIVVDEKIITDAQKPIRKMIEISKKIGL